MDIIIFENGNGGEVAIENGDILSTESTTNQNYLAHFGGNVEQSINPDRTTEEDFSWWGNLFLDDNAQMNSELERSLKNEALSSAGISRIENAAQKDVDFLSTFGTIQSTVNLINVDSVEIVDNLIINKQKNSYIYKINQSEIIEERYI